jgi:Uma2 family endonuclease
MATTKNPVTIEEYEKLEPPRDGHYELRHGEVAKVTFPTKSHYRIQNRIADLLRAQSREWGFVGIELAFRPLEQYELWAADVAAVSGERWNAAPEKGWLMGSPELVVEILSASNTEMEMLDRERTCMTGGCVEFWIVDPKFRLVRVTRNDNTTATFGDSDSIPLRLFGEASLPVSRIFAD